MFESGYSYNTICHQRLAISAYHVGLDGKSVGENSFISSLITGIFNQRPPKPWFPTMWNVRVVIDYLKRWMRPVFCQIDFCHL